ncbi:hypothetical protein CHRYSEOSP005_15260 [Chryseobacterium sp. Alg-005]
MGIINTNVITKRPHKKMTRMLYSSETQLFVI